MYTLYIDTHYSELVLALFLDGKLIDTKVLDSNLHSKNTVPLLKELLDHHSLSIDNLGEVLVINGPGSFTGVRIGIVVAKMIGYTKNIPIKAISYLQAMSLSYHQDVVLGIRDRNGIFVGEFNANHELINDYFYLSNEEVKNFEKDIKLDTSVDYQKVYDFMKEMNSVSPHLLKPLYVKKLEVGK